LPEVIEIAVAWAIVITTLWIAATVFTIARGRARGAGQATAPDRQELIRLRDAVERLGGEVTDLPERVDFAERPLAQHREAERLKS
jgi:hypothetical protein